ncbi:UDP-galactopyranose mutase [Phyllobacterium sp. KW56]|nr:UDP-galactopyranose mutase [Phyllobacterium sp. KW56]MBZ9605289.1 UDP-galactopyranose mutase [Phyllobacterium sp. KW56]
MERFAVHQPVFFFEEMIGTDHHAPYFEFHTFKGSRVKCIRPRIPHTYSATRTRDALEEMVRQLIDLSGGRNPTFWFYTPMMYDFARKIDAELVIYDCMDELANFLGAPARLHALEAELMRRADVVFTGGYSLFEAKRLLHDNIHPFPSGVDIEHFRIARNGPSKLPGATTTDRPRLGYCGVIDERLDLALIAATAAARPNWTVVLIGPVVKISQGDLPRAPNIRYVGQVPYADLPAHLAGWDVAIMPFALNDATRFISPTKTPEYLASGRPVVSTPVKDVVRHYGGVKGVFIADDSQEFIELCERALSLKKSDDSWLVPVDEILASCTWDETFNRMNSHLDAAMVRRAESVQNLSRPSIRRQSRPGQRYDYLIVGAGFAGSVLAERLASDGGKRVLLCDRRPHVGGNAYDFHDASGILVHKYGPHIFHTNSDAIFSYLSRFTAWRVYEHRVLADVGGMLLPIPINRTTLNGLYQLDLENDGQAAAFLASRAENLPAIISSKDAVVATVGRDLYRTFFEGYTRKQWGLDPSELDKSVTARIPTRTNTDDRYFQDSIQAMPLHGYSQMFENMLDLDNIDILLEAEFSDVRKEYEAAHTIFTGPIDEYYGYRYGALPYRSLQFQHETHDRRRFQPVGVINYPSEEIPYTRITEYKHLTGQVHPKTSVSYEFACAEGDPYYPIPRPENQALFKRYEQLAKASPNVTFVGRLATYKYYNMDQVVGQALATYRRLKNFTSGEKLASRSEQVSKACSPSAE